MKLSNLYGVRAEWTMDEELTDHAVFMSLSADVIASDGTAFVIRDGLGTPVGLSLEIETADGVDDTWMIPLAPRP